MCTVIRHRIDTGDAKPIKQQSSRIPVFWESEIQKMINEYLERGIIRNSQSEWCSRMVIVPKKDGTPRMCVDYRELNNLTVKDRYPIPRIDATLDKLSEAKIFSVFDATSGYHQIALEPEDM